ncbi:MAG TPA: response regulator [Thermoanaerobaculia bacterium]|nr:response regulator [Thermoanaerobaculia bacterium]
MTTLRVVIVDDEPGARSLLAEYLAAEPDVELVAACANGFEAVKAVGELRPDLLLLDVQMPKLDGFEVLELLEAPPAVVFVTAYDEHAVRAFDVHAVDYLVKPFPPERLAASLARVRERLARGEAGAPPARATTAARGRPLERLVVRAGERIHVLPLDRVDYVEARDDAVRVRAGKEDHFKPQTLADLEATLPPGRFVRIHRSYLLNLDRLARLERYAKDSHLAILQDGTRLPVSRAGYARLKTLL